MSRTNRKGQFSIIAALLVAVILIATVVVTYSTIRNSPIQSQPQVLSAVDETNLAIKQILGFTVGYYGSVLQVTGNSSYAKTLAMNYLHSGLVNIANMHPQWGTSFLVDDSELYTHWFTNSSYSTGDLDITYNLTGLGISGITYKTSCKLSVGIIDINSTTQAGLSITKDEDEPMINLGKQNFKFYRYNYENSTWQQVSPSTEPVSFANGTYQIDFPSGVDPYSYMVQVEDPRGIVAVASSFSRYVCQMAWNPQPPAKYAVAGSTPAITGAPNGSYATVANGETCEVTAYQGGAGKIRQVFFNTTYYGSQSGTIEWYYQLDGGSWVKIEDLPEGGSEVAPLARTYNATNLRPTWSWSNLNSTSIRFKNNFNTGNAYVDAIYVTVVYDIAGDYSTISNETVVVELLQNGTMRWLGQNLQSNTQAKPIPPIPVKAIHVNQTINGVNSEVPFQIEDWTSEYRIPLGLTNNASVFNSGTMLVFLANSRVSRVTIWWNGSDSAVQTAQAYTNRYFTGDNPAGGLLTNGIMSLNVITSSSRFQIKSTIGMAESTARFMRINNEWSVYGALPAYVIHHGIVRDIIQQEAEWGGGADNCPNLYAQIVLTFPANATYYTYHLRLMFIQSQQSRIITDLCPIMLTAQAGQAQTENGTSDGFPVVSNATDVFYNYSASTWAHHWSQIISGTGGSGIMSGDMANQRLYAFDGIAGNKTGAVKASTAASTIELLPVTRFQVNFTHALDVTWNGAVVTFSSTKPIYIEEAQARTGLWTMAEYPPAVAVTTES